MNDHTLANALGWASLGLGVPQTLAPRRFAEAIGAHPGDRTAAVVRYACGLRELGAAAGILAQRRPTPLVWARVAGDALDVALLGVALTTQRRSDGRRLGLAAGAVAGIAALDLYTALKLTRKGEPPREEIKRHEPYKSDKLAITIRHPREGLERLWRDHTATETPGWMEGAVLSFRDAPGNRGTEVHVQLSGAKAVPEAKDDLRRFKQIVETGEVVRSEATPEGQKTKRLFAQKPAQAEPVEASR